MKGLPAAAFLLAVSLPAAAENWRPLYEDDAIGVSVDTASLSRREQFVVFREREFFHKPELDPASMRPVQEVRYLRQADCALRKLSTLSRAAFSAQGVMVQYEATKPEAATWELPRTGRELRLLEVVCGPAS
jgi:hypothetical protein